MTVLPENSDWKILSSPRKKDNRQRPFLHVPTVAKLVVRIARPWSVFGARKVANR